MRDAQEHEIGILDPGMFFCEWNQTEMDNIWKKSHVDATADLCDVIRCMIVLLLLNIQTFSTFIYFLHNRL